MTEWRRIQVKITEDENKIILNYMKKNKIKNKNKFVRRAIEDLIGVSLADAKRKKNIGLPKDYLAVYEFYKKLHTELKPYPKISRKLDVFFKSWKNEFFLNWVPKYNEQLFKSGKMFDKFREHKPRGRPKNEKGKRGRPKT